MIFFFFFFSSRRRHTRSTRDWSSDVCSSDLSWIFRRHRQRNIHDASVFPLPRGFIMVDALATANASEDYGFLIEPLRWNEDRNRLADHFFGRVAEQSPRAVVPARDDAVEGLCQDGILGGLDDCSD